MNRDARRAAALFCALAVLAHAPHALADDDTNAHTTCGAGPNDATRRLYWDEDWPRFRPIGYALVGASVAAALAVTLFVPYPDEPHWVGGILIDKDVRNALRARNPATRDAIRTTSDITLATSIAQVALVDSLIVPLADGSSDVAFQLLLMDAQAFSLNTLISTLTSKVVARARPTVVDCRRDPNFDPLCKQGSFASIPSSHTSTAFTAAGLTCIYHQYLPLYGGGWDTAACAWSLTLAGATGMFRIVGDRHYVSDVVLGAAIGFSLGYVYPYLFHFGDGAAHGFGKSTSDLQLGPVLGAGNTPYGASVIGQF
jgi:membrane-associated phospholipid phosphatase